MNVSERYGNHDEKWLCWLTWYLLEVDLLDLEKYSAEPMDGGVVAWPVHHTEPNRARGRVDITFEVKAQVLVEGPIAEAAVASAPIVVEETITEENHKDEL